MQPFCEARIQFEAPSPVQERVLAACPRQQLEDAWIEGELAAAGDEVANRHRSENFGSPDDWLTRAKADVIVAFFGYNESFKGAEGLPKFKADLDAWIKHVRGGNYSGKGAPRVALVSPAANERQTPMRWRQSLQHSAFYAPTSRRKRLRRVRFAAACPGPCG